MNKGSHAQNYFDLTIEQKICIPVFPSDFTAFLSMGEPDEINDIKLDFGPRKTIDFQG